MATASKRSLTWTAATVALVLLAGQFVVYFYSNSLAALADVVTSLVNLIVAGTLVLELRGKNVKRSDLRGFSRRMRLQLLLIGLQTWALLLAAVFICHQAVGRAFFSYSTINPDRVANSLIMLGMLAAINTIAAAYLYLASRHQDEPRLRNQLKHFYLDLGVTAVVAASLGLVHWLQFLWIDLVAAVLLALGVVWLSLRLAWRGMDRALEEPNPAVVLIAEELLRDQVSQGLIAGYRDLQHRQIGSVHWLHARVLVPGDLSVDAAYHKIHEIESRLIERIGEEQITTFLAPAPIPPVASLAATQLLPRPEPQPQAPPPIVPSDPAMDLAPPRA